METIKKAKKFTFVVYTCEKHRGHSNTKQNYESDRFCQVVGCPRWSKYVSAVDGEPY